MREREKKRPKTRYDDEGFVYTATLAASFGVVTCEAFLLKIYKIVTINLLLFKNNDSNMVSRRYSLLGKFERG